MAILPEGKYRFSLRAFNRLDEKLFKLVVYLDLIA
jgi:hypothetical protein